MNCYFCKKRVSDPAYNSPRTYTCLQHDPAVFYYADPLDTWHMAYFSALHNDKVYSIYHYFLENKTIIISPEFTSLIKFGYIADLTPENIKQKLPTILTFL